MHWIKLDLTCLTLSIQSLYEDDRLGRRKNRELKSDPKRGICFEDIVAAIESGGLLDDIEHPNRAKYPGQRVLVVLANGYVYAVPYVENSGRDIPENRLSQPASQGPIFAG